MAILVEGQYQLFQKLKELDEAVKKQVAEAVRESSEFMARDAAFNVRSDTGKLKSALSVESLRDGLTARVRALPDYALAVEFGYKGITGKGNRRNKFPAFKVGGKWRVVPDLEAWANRHGIKPWLVARKVHTRGFEARPFLRPAKDHNSHIFLERVKKAIGEVRVSG